MQDTFADEGKGLTKLNACFRKKDIWTCRNGRGSFDV